MKRKSNKWRKKIFIKGIALFLICTMFTQVTSPLSLYAKKKIKLSGTCGESATWKYDEKTRTLTISGTGTVIAEGWKDCDWFEYDYEYSDVDNRINKLVIEDGITAIGRAAFESCYMSEVRLPETLTEIGPLAFSDCIGLKAIKIPKSVTKIGSEAFDACWSLKNLKVPEGVTSMGSSAIDNCRELTSLELPSTLKSNVNKLGIRWDTALRKIVNHTKQDIKVSTFKKRVSWKVNGKKVKKIKAGKTGKATAKKYKITYRTNGAKIKGKKPTSYRYGDIVYISATAEKKNGYFLGWDSVDNNSYFYEGGFDPEDDEPAFGNVTLKPTFLYYKKQQTGKNEVTISFDIRDDKYMIYQEMVVRYYTDKSKRNKSKLKSILLDKEKKSMKIKNLKKGKTYYFEFSTFYTDSDWEEDVDYIQKDPGYWGSLGKVKVK